jgi:hypothetical protein
MILFLNYWYLRIYLLTEAPDCSQPISIPSSFHRYEW